MGRYLGGLGEALWAKSIQHKRLHKAEEEVVLRSARYITKSDVCKWHKVVILYYPVSWLSSLPSIAIAIIHIIHPTPMPHELLGPISGFSLSTLIYLYYEGCRLNTEPARKKPALEASEHNANPHIRAFRGDIRLVCHYNLQRGEVRDHK